LSFKKLHTSDDHGASASRISLNVRNENTSGGGVHVRVRFGSGAAGVFCTAAAYSKKAPVTFRHLRGWLDNASLFWMSICAGEILIVMNLASAARECMNIPTTFLASFA
jgi:hypothetical protein